MNFSPRSLGRFLRLLTWMARYHGSGLVSDLTRDDARRAAAIVKA